MAGPLDELIPPPAPPGASFRFATVTGVRPLRVRLDGDTEPVASTPATISSVATGDRVLVMIYHRQLTVLGVVGGAEDRGRQRIELVELAGKTITNGARSTISDDAERTITVTSPGLLRVFFTYGWSASNIAAGYVFAIINDVDQMKYRIHNHNSGYDIWRPGSVYAEAFVEAGQVVVKAAAEVDSGGAAISFSDFSAVIYAP